MKKVFCITCHEMTNALEITVMYLSSFSENKIIIHVDRKSSLKPFFKLKRNNVHLIEDRMLVSWGGVSQVKATIKLFMSALSQSFEYLFFISGDDLPCKSNYHINKFILKINKYNLVHFQDSRNKYINPRDRVAYNYPSFFYDKGGDITLRIKKKLFHVFRFLYKNKEINSAIKKGVVFYKGTNWLSLNYETVIKIVNFINVNPWYLKLYEKSLCSDEVFFHTIIKFIGITDCYHDVSCMNDAMRYIDWHTGPDFPRVLDSSDTNLIRKSGCLFARKFKPNINPSILEELISETSDGLRINYPYNKI